MSRINELKKEFLPELKSIKKSQKSVYNPEEILDYLTVAKKLRKIMYDKSLSSDAKLHKLSDKIFLVTSYQERVTEILFRLINYKRILVQRTKYLIREFNKDSSFIKLKKKDQTSVLDAELGDFLLLEDNLKRKIDSIERAEQYLKEVIYSIRTVVSALKGAGKHYGER